MKRILKLAAAVMLLFVFAVGCTKTDDPNNNGNNGDNGGNGNGNGGNEVEAPAIVSTSEVQYSGDVYVEAIFEDSSRMYFKMLSPTTAACVHGEFYYQDNPSQAYIYRGDVVIPSSFTHMGSTYTVTAISEKAFWNNNLVSSVYMPNSVEAISSYNKKGAFQGCTGLQSIRFSENIKTIGENAFVGCPYFENTVTIPNNVVAIGRSAFESINVVFNADSCGVAGGLVPSNNPDDDLYISAFPYMQSISYGDNVKVIPSYIYTGLLYSNSFTTIDIPSSINIIAHEAFRGCISLREIRGMQNVESVGTNAFYGCTELNSIEFGNNLRTIGMGVFSRCSSLTSVSFPNSLSRIEHGAFWNSGIQTIVWGNSIETIGESAFASCKGLTELYIPNSVKTIEQSAFRWCDSLSSITIGDAVTIIEDYAFSGCQKVSALTLGNSVAEIGFGAFSYCEELNAITLPGSVRIIHDEAFNGTWIQSVTCYAIEPPVLGENVFNYWLGEIRVPQESVDAYKVADGWCRFADKIVGIP